MCEILGMSTNSCSAHDDVLHRPTVEREVVRIVGVDFWQKIERIFYQTDQVTKVSLGLG